MKTLYQKLTQWLGDVTAVRAVTAVTLVTAVTVVTAATTGTGPAIVAVGMVVIEDENTMAKVILERR